METTLGNKIQSAVILDRDYRSQEECDSIVDECKKFCEMVVVHGRKEIENFLLVPPAVDRAARNRLADKNTRTGDNQTYVDCAYSILEEISSKMKTFVTSRCLASRRRYEKLHNPGIDETTSNESALDELEAAWINESEKIRTIPGKEALSAINTELQNRYGISLTATAIIDAMTDEEVPDELRELINNLSIFAK